MLSLISSHTKFSNDAPKPNINVSYSGSYETGEFNGYKYIILKSGSNTALTLTLIGSANINVLICGSGGSGGSGNSGTGSGNANCCSGNGGNGGQVNVIQLNIVNSFNANITIGASVNGVSTSSQGQNGTDGINGNSTIFNYNSGANIITSLGGSKGKGGIIGVMSSQSVLGTGYNVGYGMGATGTNSTTKISTQDAQTGYYCPATNLYYGSGGSSSNRIGTWSSGNEQYGTSIANPSNPQKSAYASTTGIKSLAGVGLANTGQGGSSGISIGFYGGSPSNWSVYNTYIASSASGSGAVVIWW